MRRLQLIIRILLLLLGIMLWTLFTLYPNPMVLARNLARHRHLPLDPKLEQKMGWELPADPVNIELFVDSLFLQTPDWRLYRVPWYVPTALEAASSSHGDCEAKALVLASLFEGKRLPYKMRASLNHLWVDYPGRPPLQRKAECANLHQLQSVSWYQAFVRQREQLWTAMPLARKAIWLVGGMWMLAAAFLLGGPSPTGVLTSHWQVRLPLLAARAAWLAAFVFIALTLIFNLRSQANPARWTYADLREALALSFCAGAFLSWASVVRPRRAVDFAGERLLVKSVLGCWRKTIVLEASQLNHFELLASPGGLRPWKIFAVKRDGGRKTLLRYGREIAARAALRRLGREFSLPIGVHSEGYDYWTAADEIGLSLQEKAAFRPKTELPEAPPGFHLVVEQSNGQWALGYPRRDSRVTRTLLSLVAIVFAGGVIGAEFVYYLPYKLASWLIWSFTTILLGVVTYGAISLREELLAWFAGSHVEISEGELSFHRSDGKIESTPVADIESVELARRGEARTIAVVSPERIIHISLYCPSKHLLWVKQALEHALVTAR